MLRVSFYTLGCKLNFAETSTISRQFTDNGFTKVNFEEGADVYVINTCSVTDHADRKCKKIVSEALRINNNARIVIIGCYAQLKPKEISEIPGVDLVLGANEKFNIMEFLPKVKQPIGNAIVHNKKIKETSFFIPSYSISDRTRTFLKVQDGCDYFCSFCTIPLARGKSRNDTISNTIKIAQDIAKTEVKEVVLTGVNIGDFGRSTGETFFELIQQLDDIDGIDRFRISSIEPNLLSNEIIEFVSKSKKFLPHFHIPLQSGSDTLLSLMRRKYSTQLYTQRVELIKKLIPDACIGVDVIVGFPGETEELFNETYNYINSLPVSYLHVFTYSERSRTGAVKLDGKVPVATRKKRTQMLRILSEKKRHAFYQSQLNKTAEVLFEAEQHGSEMYGFTQNYVKVKMPYDPLMVNEIVKVKLHSIDLDGCVRARVNITDGLPQNLLKRLVTG